MNILKRVTGWWSGFFRRSRFSMNDAATDRELWHFHISPAGLVAAFTAFAVLVFLIILTLTAYTPVLEFLPGYRTQATRTRENVMQNLIRLDSMERIMNDMLTYNTDIALIMEGKTPVVRNVGGIDSVVRARGTVPRSAEDSALRAQMELPGGLYSIAQGAPTTRSIRESYELRTPVEGIVADRFNIKEGRYGIRLGAVNGTQVAAIDDGVVIFNLWSPESGYVTVLRHEGDMLSFYGNMSRSTVQKGQTVKQGEVIGYTSETSGDDDPGLFEFELWNNGKPVDPEGYILF